MPIPRYEENLIKDAFLLATRAYAIYLLFLFVFDVAFTAMGVVRYGEWIEGSELWSGVLHAFGLPFLVLVASIVKVVVWCGLMLLLDFVEANYYKPSSLWGNFGSSWFSNHPNVDQGLRVSCLVNASLSVLWLVIEQGVVVLTWFFLLF